MALGLLASIGIPFLTDMIGKYGEKAITAGVEKVTGVDITKKELTAAEKQLIIDSEIKIKELDFRELELSYKDTENARELTARIQESAVASGWAKVAPYIMDFLIIGSTILVGLILFWVGIPDANKELAYMLFGALITMCGTVVNFHRGSSQSSKDKDEIMRR